MKLIFGNVKGSGVLDYVCGWYMNAADFIQGTQIKVAFVSTNSITQGEQVGILWSELFKRFQLDIHFAHRTFSWQSEARGKAHVHVVIIGFASFAASSRTLFEYHDQKGEPVAISARNINPYLADAPNTLILKRKSQISGGPAISYGRRIHQP
jgi:type II restriction/modification system DNA methylase subunit YeeA